MGRRLTGRLVLATHNGGKLAEFRELLRPFGVEVTSAGELGLPVPAETGDTFSENARIKALAALSATELPALADDSGLCVEALGGAPGVNTADWAGPDRDWDVAMSRLESELQAIGARRPDQRRGTFVSSWPSSGRMVIRRSSRGGSRGSSSGRRAAPAATATTRCSSRTAGPLPLLRWRPTRRMPSLIARARSRSSRRRASPDLSSLKFIASRSRHFDAVRYSAATANGAGSSQWSRKPSSQAFTAKSCW